MTQGQIYGLVTFLAIVVVMLVRSGEVRSWQALCAGLMGFYLAMTPLGYIVTWIVNQIAKWLG
ncbi:hypothetical protein [Streptomyces kronopolitis]|uniref:hypothetical protein n=1 Tax=Streptomyces kronopolitis TaxID=1612435 RepID=UPI0020BF008D|nr:hypothetical protein [Streptomyces kronopolitis]MCL6300277.1 hypothetical protein [Streptomyces kronopolitis]